MSRVTDAMVRDFLVWGRNYGEIESFRKVRSSGRCWHIVVRPGVRKNAMGLLFAPRDEDLVPTEMVLTAREALVFGYGLAVAGASKDRREWTQEDWDARSEQRKVNQETG